ncbi:MAG: Stealth CR1 domain-containing protein [Clostridia bacterium]|nr:Stealth CR1 domain-containing protein [Clostridia bacterium]
MTNDIDIVIPWVDGSDPDWAARRSAYDTAASSDTRVNRYRDWDLLKYIFRGIERFAPWVRYVFFVCDQQPPAWLDSSNPRLRVTMHADFIPREYLPVFSSHPIELNMHRIPGLSEQFIYMNDDTFLLKPLAREFFFRRGLPRDAALLNPVPTDDLMGKRNAKIFTVPLNNAEYINRDYDFRSCIKRHPFKWFNVRYGGNLLRNAMLCLWPRFVGFKEPHLPQAFLKSAFERAWDADFDILDQTSRRPLRDDRDVNQWLIRERELAEGRFLPRKPISGGVFAIGQNLSEMHSAIRLQRIPMICLNDDGITEESEFLSLRRQLTCDFETILPEKSSFEN